MTRVFLAKLERGWNYYCSKCDFRFNQRSNVVICVLKKAEMEEKCPIHLNKATQIILEVW